ncbi:MAG: hypothetical protein QQN63_10515 [Nitrosopumilus sp.]
MRIVVVEPHPDDAFLSLGWHIEKLWKDDSVIIVTVYADEKREREAGVYADAVGAESVCLGLEESRMSSIGRICPIELLRAILAGLEWDHIVFPLGLQHPDHQRVAVSRFPGSLRYLDSPYLAKLKMAEALSRKAEGMYLYSICFPPKRKWRHVPIFKSQSKFFHFNPMADFKIPEIILK